MYIPAVLDTPTPSSGWIASVCTRTCELYWTLLFSSSSPSSRKGIETIWSVNDVKRKRRKMATSNVSFTWHSSSRQHRELLHVYKYVKEEDDEGIKLSLHTKHFIYYDGAHMHCVCRVCLAHHQHATRECLQVNDQMFSFSCLPLSQRRNDRVQNDSFLFSNTWRQRQKNTT